MKDRFLAFLETNELLPANGKLLLMVSGGPDSMAMLHLFHDLKTVVSVVHLNHGIRGKEADEDAAFVEEECRKLEIPCRLFRFDVPRFALQKKLSLEEAGRRIRRHFFTRYATMKKIDAIASAHTSDDHVETILMNFVRGTGPRGLAGIFPKQGHFIHPMLVFSKREILDYLNEKQIPYRMDASNEEVHFLRNRVRKEILPFLEAKIGYDLKNGLSRLGQIFQDEEAWLSEHVDSIFLLRVKEIRKNFYELRMAENEFPVGLMRRLIRRFIEYSMGSIHSVSMAQIDAILQLLGKETGKRFLAAEFLIEKTRQGLLLALRRGQVLTNLKSVPEPVPVIFPKGFA